MAKDKKPSTSCLLSCFGTSEDREPTAGTQSDRHDKQKKKKSRWLVSLSRVWIKKSGAKTVPVDTTAAIVVADIESEKAEAKRRYDESRSKSKVGRSKSSEKLSGSKRRVKEVSVPAAPDQDRPRGITSEVSAPAPRNPVEESRSDHPEPEPKDPCQLQRGLSFCRKIDCIRARAVASSQPGSPIIPTRPLSRSSSFPIPAAAPGKKPQKRAGGFERNLDPFVGMSIILVTLMIMVLWGRLCAILCTCAWFYFIPRMRSMGQPNNDDITDPKPNRNGLDLSSEEYKKKVVLEGLLERNRRGLPRENGVS